MALRRVASHGFRLLQSAAELRVIERPFAVQYGITALPSLSPVAFLTGPDWRHPFALEPIASCWSVQLCLAQSLSTARTASPELRVDRPSSPVPDAKECDDAMENYDKLLTKYRSTAISPPQRSYADRIRSTAGLIMGVLVATKDFMFSIPRRTAAVAAMNREDWRKWRSETWQFLKAEGHHYWVGTKLLAYDVRIASRLAWKAAKGNTLTRRERKQLTRTTADLFRLVPMIVILVIPFMELALPLLLRLFPNILPSTYEDKLKKEEEMKKRLAVKLEVARFLQATVAEMAEDINRRRTGEVSATAAKLLEFMNRVRAGEPVENHELVRFASLFNDELTLDNLERAQLVSLCQFIGITPFGTDAFLRNRLRAALQQIKADDRDIAAEGLDSLSDEELRQACRLRGMKAPYGEGATAFMRRQMQDWLDLSLKSGLPSSLLLLSRAFTITATVRDTLSKRQKQYAVLREALSTLPEEMVADVSATTATATNTAQDLQAKLDFLKHEEERIREEESAQEAATAAAAAAVPRAVADSGTTSMDNVRQAAAAATAAAVVKEAAAGLRAEGSSMEEKAAAAERTREEKLRQLVGALSVLASSSGVSSERATFMELMRAEVNRLNEEAAQRGSSSMVFTGRGLEAQRPEDSAAGLEPGVAPALSARVSGILRRIEKELDKTEELIGQRMHLLDTDGDGVISREELQAAVRFLHQQLGDDELKALLERLCGSGNTEQNISVLELMALAHNPEHNPAQEVVAIHVK